MFFFEQSRGHNEGAFRLNEWSFLQGNRGVLAPVVQKVDNAIHRINHYPVDSAIGFPNPYPLDSDL